MDTRQNVKVKACFEPLTASDNEILKGEDWQAARFGDVWKELAEREVAQKLTLCEGEERPVLGLVQIGTVQRTNGGERMLCHSLLEAAPVHRHGTAQRRYTGIGRALIARLIVESKAQGAEGRLLVRPVPSSIPFYRKLEFQEARIPLVFPAARLGGGSIAAGVYARIIGVKDAQQNKRSSPRRRTSLALQSNSFHGRLPQPRKPGEQVSPNAQGQTQ